MKTIGQGEIRCLIVRDRSKYLVSKLCTQTLIFQGKQLYLPLLIRLFKNIKI